MVPAACSAKDEYRYGDDATWHRTGEVNVEIGPDGKVCAVWFRCHPLPFTESPASEDRAADMRRMYDNPPPVHQIKAVVFEGPGPLISQPPEEAK